jgi:hypothetical protein
MKLSPIVYLDTSFITDAYESFTGKPVPIKVVKSETVSGGFSVGGLLSAGATMRETKEFPISARAMYKKMQKDFASFPTINLATDDPKVLPEYFWVSGQFTLGSSEVTRQGEVIHRDSYFRLFATEADKRAVYMLTSDNYFSAGYDQILRHVHGATRGFSIEVTALVKLIAMQKGNFWPLCAPLVIEKTGSA